MMKHKESCISLHLFYLCSNFQKPVAVKTTGNSSASLGPAPNAYNPSISFISPNKLVTGEASFKSGSSRVIPISWSHSPGPGSYSPKYELTHNSSYQQTACFVSGSKREVELGLPSSQGPGKSIVIFYILTFAMQLVVYMKRTANLFSK